MWATRQPLTAEIAENAEKSIFSCVMRQGTAKFTAARFASGLHRHEKQRKDLMMSCFRHFSSLRSQRALR